MVDERSGATPWFTGKETGALMLFRVNRRPLPQASLFGEPPEDVLAHFEQALLFGEPVETGRRHRRIWRLGNKSLNTEEDYLSGHIGYESAGERTADRYDQESKSWIDAVDVVEATGRSPFVFYASNRYLAVLQHAGFSPSSMQKVFKDLLQAGENRLLNRTTEWDVEPILDERNFLEWLRSAQSVQKVSFTARLPNPEGRQEFEPVWSRLEARRARAIREIMEARDPDLGLEGVEDDEILRAYIAMAAEGYGDIRAERKYENQTQTYVQRDKVRRGYIQGPLPSSWLELIILIVNFLRGQR